MGKVLGDSPREDFPVPDRVVSLLVDEDPSGECLRPVSMAFIKGSEAGVVCNGVGQPRVVIAPPATPAPQVGVPSLPLVPTPGQPLPAPGSTPLPGSMPMPSTPTPAPPASGVIPKGQTP
jgi:hypothetical protein